MFGRKNKERIKELEAKIDALNIANDAIRREFKQLRRILKHADKEPTFELKSKIRFETTSLRKPGYFYVYENNTITVKAHDLYIYIDHNEYCIGLDELNNLTVDKGSAAFWVEDGFAHFDILTGEKQRTRHKFVIDYKRGNYLYSQEPFGANGGDTDGETV